MCGIAGTIAFQEPAARLNISLIGHRGPDASGEWISPDSRVWFGHTRLAILDLTPNGAQPMHDATTGNVITFNGEIYNHLEIRRELAEIGNVTFHGTSDTETLLHAYRIWGRDILPRLEGMFAFAIYEAGSKSVFLARDRFGIKPLYIRRNTQAGGLNFCSEVRPLLVGQSQTVTKESLAAYLHWGSCPHDRLLFSEIEELPAGSSIRIPIHPLEHASAKPKVYWPPQKTTISFARQIPAGVERPEAVKKVRALLEDSVHKHLLSDVPVACFLSGGIDSSIVVALASRLAPKNKLATFSVGFTESKFDESVFAQTIADQYKTDHHHIQLADEEKLALAQEAIAAMDLPSYDAINTYIVSKKVAQAGYKVVLSGLGADELFGGYPIFRDYFRIRAFAAIPKPFRNLAASLGRGVHLFSDVPADKTGETISRWSRRRWHGGLLAAVGLDSPRIQPSDGPVIADAMGELSWGEMTFYMRDVLLRDSDAMSMAHSLEMRVPFLDNDLVDYVLPLPAKIKFDTRRPKSLLLDAAADLIPDKIWNRPKMGFVLPMREWMMGPMREFCEKGIASLGTLPHIHHAGVLSVWEKFLSGRGTWEIIWTAVVLGNYLAEQGRAK